MIWIIAPRCGRRYYKKMRSMTRHSPRQLAQLAQLALAIVVAGLVAMASTMPAQAQTQQAPAAGVQAAEYPFGFKAHGSVDEMAVTGLAKGPRLAGSVVGFYAPPALQGVITHGGDYFHSHYVDAQRSTTAHLDSFGIAAGSTLMLPMQH